MIKENIYDYYILSEDNINSRKTMDSDYIKKQVEKIRASATDILLSNKVWGGVVRIITGVDWP